MEHIEKFIETEIQYCKGFYPWKTVEVIMGSETYRRFQYYLMNIEAGKTGTLKYLEALTIMGCKITVGDFRYGVILNEPDSELEKLFAKVWETSWIYRPAVAVDLGTAALS